jgi:hypothetical protein
MNEIPKKKGKRGRIKGSTSFARINITDLINCVGQNASIVVSKKWLDDIGVTITPAPVKTVPAQAKIETEEKVQFSVHSFD